MQNYPVYRNMTLGQSVSCPNKGKRAFESKVVCKKKRNAQNVVTKHKVRLVAKGFSQLEGLDYFETTSPVVSHAAMRTLIATAAAKGHELFQIDIENAFLNAPLEEEIYMRMPKGMRKFDNQGREIVCRLNKAVYGLKQASRAFYKKLRTVLLGLLGFKPCLVEPCLFRLEKDGQEITVSTYVDDMPSSCSDPKLKQWFLDSLKKEFTITEGPLQWCLGVKVEPASDGGVNLSQQAYIGNVYNAFAQDVKHRTYSVPLDPDVKLAHVPAPVKDSYEWKHAQEKPYRQLVGALLYCCITRPDVQFAVLVLAGFMQNWSMVHYRAAIRVITYLHQTSHLCLHYSRSAEITLKSLSDAEFASQHPDCRSVSGFLIYLGTSLISWASKKQTLVALSTAAAEYYALSVAVQEVAYLKVLMGFLGHPLDGPTTMHVGVDPTLKYPSFP